MQNWKKIHWLHIRLATFSCAADYPLGDAVNL